MLVFQLADRWGESDPRKIAAMPAHILNHWRAYFKLQGMTADAAESARSSIRSARAKQY